MDNRFHLDHRQQNSNWNCIHADELRGEKGRFDGCSYSTAEANFNTCCSPKKRRHIQERFTFIFPVVTPSTFEHGISTILKANDEASYLSRNIQLDDIGFGQKS